VILRLAAGVLLLFVMACSNDSSPKGDQVEFDVKVLKNDAAIADFVNRHPEWPVIKYARADLNNDGRQDVVIIYRIAKDTNRMRVVLDIGGKYSDTNEAPAPLYDQSIVFRDIDKKPPVEFIVQGRKGAKIGYAIFRIENEQLIDIFGEGMEDCC
jgi:hypothetical protein